MQIYLKIFNAILQQFNKNIVCIEADVYSFVIEIYVKVFGADVELNN